MNHTRSKLSDFDFVTLGPNSVISSDILSRSLRKSKQQDENLSQKALV